MTNFKARGFLNVSHKSSFLVVTVTSLPRNAKQSQDHSKPAWPSFQGRFSDEWSVWTPFGPCSKTCSGGTKYRFRLCQNGRTIVSSKNCPGPSSSLKLCKTEPCAGKKAAFYVSKGVKNQHALRDINDFLYAASRITDRTKFTTTKQKIANVARLWIPFKHQKSSFCECGVHLMPDSNRTLTSMKTNLSF